MINHSSTEENISLARYVANKCNNNRHCIFEKPEARNDRLCALFPASYFTLAFYYHFSFLCSKLTSSSRTRLPTGLAAFLNTQHPFCIYLHLNLEYLDFSHPDHKSPKDNDPFGNDTINRIKYKKPIFIEKI